MKQKIIILLLTFILFFPFIINAKEIERGWGISWGGDGTETISDFKVTSDDGLIVCGSTSSTMAGSENIEGNKIFLSKHDKNGKVEWQKFFSENEYTLFRSVDIIPDKGYLIRGTLMNDTRDAIIILFDFDGNIVWTKEFKKNDTDIFINMLQIDDESFFVVGTTESTDIEGSEFKGKVDVLLIKYDFDGNIIYKKTWGTKDYDEITESYINNKNELIICGTSTDAEGYKVYGADAFILKYDFDGNLIQEKLFGGDGRDTATGVIPISDDSLLMILSSNSSSIGDLNLGNNKDFHDLLVKFDENLDLLWVKDIGLSQNTRISDYVFTEDNELVILMNVNGVDFNNIKNKGKADSVIIKYDENFDLVFQKVYGGN